MKIEEVFIMTHSRETLIGLIFNTDVDTNDIIEAVGTDFVRIYSTEMGVTMDYVEERVNVVYDVETKVILSVDNG